MKKDIHPKWYKETAVTCGCGNTFTVGSTVPEIRVEICSMCHPFYTGEQKFVDTEGMVEKFQKKAKKTKEIKKVYDEKKKEKETKKIKLTQKPQTLKDMLKAARTS